VAGRRVCGASGAAAPATAVRLGSRRPRTFNKHRTRRPGLGQQAYTKDGALRLVAHAPHVGEGSHRVSVLFHVRGPHAPGYVSKAAQALAQHQ
jgi:hypothetical protein